jgi:hypothetical protein
VHRYSDKLAVRRVKYLENERHEVSAEDSRACFANLTAHLTSSPSQFFWIADDIRVGSAKHMSHPDVIVASGTKQSSVIVPEIRDDAQLTLLLVISEFGNSTSPYFISQNKRFEKTARGAQQLFESGDHAIGTATKTFIPEIFFIEWIEAMFRVQINELRQQFGEKGAEILLVFGFSRQVTPRATVSCGANHNSYISQPLDLCLFGIFRILFEKEKQAKRMKGETRPIHAAPRSE